MKKHVPERRQTVIDPVEQHIKDVEGIAARSRLEGRPISEIKLRERGKEREKIIAEVNAKVGRLFGSQVPEPAPSQEKPKSQSIQAVAPEPAPTSEKPNSSRDRYSVMLSPEQYKLHEKFRNQYSRMKKILEDCGVSTVSVPGWDIISRGLTNQVLDKTSGLQKPSLLLVPPTSLKSKCDAIGKRKIGDQQYSALLLGLYKDLLIDGQPNTETGWRISVVEECQDPAHDPDINRDGSTNYQVIKSLAKKFEDKNLDFINDSDTYVILSMKKLADGEPVDTESITVLNGKSLVAENSIVRYGFGYPGRVVLASGLSEYNPRIRLRGMVRVDVLPPLPSQMYRQK